jgi:molybdopterin-binding protein
VVYYFGAKLPAGQMVATYESLERTNFVTLYAATHPADDFAEAFASYVHGVLMGRPWEISIAREPPDDSSLNHVRRPITSLVRIGNRARVQVGPLVGEVTTASVERLGLREGETVVASFKAAATHLVARND